MNHPQDAHATKLVNEIEVLRQRVKELETMVQHRQSKYERERDLYDQQSNELAAANRGAERNAHINRELAQELAALKQGQGEPVGVAGFVNEDYGIDWVSGVCSSIGDPLYTFAPRPKEPK